MKRININDARIRGAIHSVSYCSDRELYTISSPNLYPEDIAVLQAATLADSSYFWMEDMYDKEVHEFEKVQITYLGSNSFHVLALTERKRKNDNDE